MKKQLFTALLACASAAASFAAQAVNFITVPQTVYNFSPKDKGNLYIADDYPGLLKIVPDTPMTIKDAELRVTVPAGMTLKVFALPSHSASCLEIAPKTDSSGKTAVFSFPMNLPTLRNRAEHYIYFFRNGRISTAQKFRSKCFLTGINRTRIGSLSEASNFRS